MSAKTQQIVGQKSARKNLKKRQKNREKQLTFRFLCDRISKLSERGDTLQTIRKKFRKNLKKMYQNA